MPSQEEIDSQLQRLHLYRRTLTGLRNRLAIVGGLAYAPPELTSSIDETCEGIRQCKNTLRVWHFEVEDLPDDELSVIDRVVGEPRRPGATPTGNRVYARRDAFGAGMGALRELMESFPHINDAAVAFRADFRTACKHIQVLRSYKLLHEQLHELQQKCYKNIELEAQRFPHDSTAVMNLDTYAFDLEKIVDKLNDIVTEAPSVRSKVDCIDALRRAHHDMSQAINQSDPILLKRSVGQLRRIIDIYPARVNKLLNGTVQLMQLDDLVERMRNICDLVDEVASEVEQARRLREGFTILETVSAKLTSLVEHHDRWQLIDVKLNVREGALVKDDLDLLLEDLQEHAAQLYTHNDEQWAVALRQEQEHLERAVYNGDPLKIAESFRSYQRRAQWQFFRTDDALNKLCEKLDRIDGPLSFVMGVLE